jgi:geranylgeranyl transferase type-2 subunit alpha
LAKWANLPIEDEFDFTTLKIYQNFSNYSAWQRRSHLFVDFVSKMSAVELDSFIRNEVELCRNAAWTEPSDQSIWFYQRWLFESLPHQLPSSVCDLLQTKLAREQVDSITKLIDEEKQGNCVALAMSFVRFVLLKVLNEANDSRVSEYLDRLEVVDPLRRGHWNSMK